MFFGADYNNPAFMGYLIVVVCAGLILNWRAAIGWSIISILTSAVILILGQRGYPNCQSRRNASLSHSGQRKPAISL